MCFIVRLSCYKRQLMTSIEIVLLSRELLLLLRLGESEILGSARGLAYVSAGLAETPLT